MFNFAVVGLGPWEIALIVLVVLLLFGARRLPEVGRSLGQGMREFKNSVTGKDGDEERGELEPSSAKVDAAADDRERAGDRPPATPAQAPGETKP